MVSKDTPMSLCAWLRVVTTLLLPVGTAWCLSGPELGVLVPVDASPSAALDLLREETLDTVDLEKPVHFVTPETMDTVAAPGTYRVETAERDRLKLVSEKRNRTVVVMALPITHVERIATPIALQIRDDDKFPHVVLLMPDGNGLDAVGSYDAVRSRGQRSSLTGARLNEALGEKLAAQGQRAAGRGKPHD